MLEMNRRLMLRTSAAALAAVGLQKTQSARASSYQSPGSYTPADLGGVLTPFGAVKAGNADGSIPAWTGGYSEVPAGYKSGDPRPIPFADEKPLYVITAANFHQYQEKLSAGMQALFEKYPNYTMQIFPTHRTAIAPQWVYDNINKNTKNARLSADGNSITGAYGGIPFPIPKNGHEVIWNHLLSWNGTIVEFVSDSHAVTSSGGVILESRAHSWYKFPYYVKDGESDFNGFYLEFLGDPTAPPYQAGASIMILFSINPTVRDNAAWEYLQGQRRVRRAPELEFDTPNSLTGGTVNWDEANVFQGKLVEYDIDFLGIKEMYIPYNANKLASAPVADQLRPHFLNPDLLRWELHRCRVVEMKLKSGFRNVDTRRILYCDEDTGGAVMCDVYGANGTLWKALQLLPVAYPDIPCVQVASNFIGYDLHSGVYTFSNHFDAETLPQWKTLPSISASYFTPGQLAALSGGF